MFSADRFAEETGCDVYRLTQPASEHDGSNYPDRLLDHGFIADRACVWDKRLEGHEMAIVARTYCDDTKIDNPPDGLCCVRLDDSVLGGAPGTAIAVVITGKTEAAEAVLSACTSMPADMLAFMIPLSMQYDGYCIALKTNEGSNFPVVRLVKI